MMRHFFLSLIILSALPLSIGTAFAQNLATIDSRLSQLESEIRRLTGKIEEQSFKIRKLEDELERRMSDAELRLQDIEQKQREQRTTTSDDRRPEDDRAPWQAPAGNPAGETLPAQGNATDIYEDAFATLRGGNYDMAEQKFLSFLADYPNHSLTDNARYWLAETYYVRNEYERAARGFAQAYQKNPQGPKAADNLLKLGLSLSGLGKTDEACIALNQLLEDFSQGPRSVITRAKQEEERLGCS
jgi:tol-pal system protein YbgF